MDKQPYKILKVPCIYKDDNFTIEHTTTFDIPGYLILFLNDNQPLHKQNPEILSQLGHILAITTHCIKEITKADRVYCLSFGETIDIPHFHLFPRTPKIKKEYNKNICSSEKVISGPDLFAWIMQNKKGYYKNIDFICKKFLLNFDKNYFSK